MIVDFERIFNIWSEEIEKVLKDVETVPTKTKTPAPKPNLKTGETE